MKAKKLKKDLPLFFQMLWSSQNIQTLFVKYLKLFNFFPDHRATPLRGFSVTRFDFTGA